MKVSKTFFYFLSLRESKCIAVAVDLSAKALQTQGCDRHASWIQGKAEAEAATEKKTEAN